MVDIPNQSRQNIVLDRTCRTPNLFAPSLQDKEAEFQPIRDCAHLVPVVLFGVAPPAVDDDVATPLPPLDRRLGHVQAEPLVGLPVGEGGSNEVYRVTRPV